MKAAFDFPLHPLAREDGERLRGAWFDEPDEWLVADAPADLAALIDRAHCAALQGAWVLGGLRYEAAAALDPVLRVLPNEGGPLAQFAVYRRPPQPWPTSVAGATERCAPWQQCLHDEAADHAAIERVREVPVNGAWASLRKLVWRKSLKPNSSGWIGLPSKSSVNVSMARSSGITLR